MEKLDQAVVVTYSEDGRRHDSFQHLVTTTLSYGDVLQRLRDGIRSEDIMVLHEVDAQAILSRSNYKIGPTSQILFFHPRLMARLLGGDPAALLEAPLKFSVVQGDQFVSVRWQDPAPSFARYGNPELAKLGQELSDVCKRIAEKALSNADAP